MRETQPPPDVFDESLAKILIGKSLLIGISHADSAGNIVRRSQVFGTVIIADRSRGIYIRDRQGRQEEWVFPPDTRGIKPAPPGEYRNRATGEVVNDPDYLGTWMITAGKQASPEKVT